MTILESFEAFITLPMLGDDTDTTEFNILFDAEMSPGSIDGDKWTGEAYPNEYEIKRAQLEVSDGVWAELPAEHYHLIQEAIDEVCDAYYQKQGEE